MKWFSAQEIADMAKAGELPGYPKSSRGISRLARRKEWAKSKLSRPRKGKKGGGGLEYHIDLLSDGGKYDAAIQFLWAVNRGQTIHARIIILGVARRFQKYSEKSEHLAERQFCELYNIGVAGFPTWIRHAVKSISSAQLAQWRLQERSQ